MKKFTLNLLNKLCKFISYCFFPQACFSCGEPLYLKEGALCEDCLRNTFMYEGDLHCPSCYFKEKNLCSFFSCQSPFEELRAVFYATPSVEPIWGFLKQHEVWSKESRAFQSLYLAHILTMLDEPIDEIVFISESKQQKKLKEIGKELKKKLKKAKMLRTKKEQIGCDTKITLVIMDHLKKLYLHDEMLLQRKENGERIFGVALTSSLPIDASWKLRPIGKDFPH